MLNSAFLKSVLTVVVALAVWELVIKSLVADLITAKK